MGFTLPEPTLHFNFTLDWQFTFNFFLFAFIIALQELKYSVQLKRVIWFRCFLFYNCGVYNFCVSYGVKVSLSTNKPEITFDRILIIQKPIYNESIILLEYSGCFSQRKDQIRLGLFCNVTTFVVSLVLDVEIPGSIRF